MITEVAIIVLTGLCFGGLAALVLLKMDVAAGRRGKTAYAKWLNDRYVRKFNDQLTDALGSMSNAMRAGFSLNQAFQSVADMQLHPISDEFELYLQQQRVGMSVEDALAEMERRIGSEDLTLVLTAIDISRRTGGNLTEIFDTIADTIRARMKIERRVRTLTAQGRMQGMIVSLMPVALGGILAVMRPGLMIPFLCSLQGAGCVLGMILLVSCGWLCIRKITRIDV